MERLDLFATPVVVFDVPGMDALNSELTELLLDEEKRVSGLQRSNYGGWHSAMDLMQRPHACFQALTRSILDHVDRVVAGLTPQAARPGGTHLRVKQQWAMIMHDGDYTVMHDHGLAHWSTAYYADAGDAGGDEPSGGLAFTDPRRGVRPIPELDLFPALFTFQPRSSSLVVFPGWLKHQVYTYRGKRPRISISSNLLMDVPSPASAHPQAAQAVTS